MKPGAGDVRSSWSLPPRCGGFSVPGGQELRKLRGQHGGVSLTFLMAQRVVQVYFPYILFMGLLRGKHPRELQIWPYLTSQAFDVGRDERRSSEWSPDGDASGRTCACMSLLFPSRRETTFRLRRAPPSQKAKLIGST